MKHLRLIIALTCIYGFMPLTVLPQKLGAGTKISGGVKLSSAAGGGGTFPTNSIKDNFNRTNEGPPLSTQWSALYGGTAFWDVLSNQARATDTGQTYYNVATYGPDFEVYATLTVFNTFATLYGGMIDIGSGTSDGYELYYSANTLGLYIVTNTGDGVQVGSNITQTVSNGDSFGFKRVSGTFTAYYCASGAGCGVSGAGWASIGVFGTDTTYTAAGAIGIGGLTSTQMDDFGGGSL